MHACIYRELVALALIPKQIFPDEKKGNELRCRIHYAVYRN